MTRSSGNTWKLTQKNESENKTGEKRSETEAGRNYGSEIGEAFNSNSRYLLGDRSNWWITGGNSPVRALDVRKEMQRRDTKAF